MSVVRELVATLGLKLDPSGFTKATGMFANVGAQIGSLSRNFETISDWADSKAKSVGGSLFNMAVSAVSSISDMNAHLAKSAPAMGETAQSLQGLEYAFGAFGAPAGAVGAAMDHLREQFKAAEMGSMGAMRALQGISPREGGKLRSIGDIMEQVAEKISKVKDPMEQANMATKIFGSTGLDLLPLLQQGAAGMAKYRAEVKAFGAEVMDEDILATKEMRLELQRLNLVTMGYKQSVAGPLMSTVGKAIEGFTKWKLAQEKLGQSGAKDVRQGFDQFRKFADMMTKAMIAADKAATFIGKWIDVVLIGLGAIMAAPILLWVAGLVAGGVATTAAWLVPLATFIGIAAALFLVGLAVEDVIGYLNGADSLTGRLIDGFGKWIDEFMKPQEGDPWWLAWLRFLARYWTGAIEGVRNFVTTVRDIFAEFFGWLEGKFQLFTKIGQIASKVGGAVGKGLSAASDFAGGVIGDLGARDKSWSVGSTVDDETARGFIGPRQAGSIGPASTSAGSGGGGKSITDNRQVNVKNEFNYPGVVDPVIASQKTSKDFDDSMSKILGPLK